MKIIDQTNILQAPLALQHCYRGDLAALKAMNFKEIRNTQSNALNGKPLSLAALLAAALGGQLAVVEWLVREKGFSLKEKDEDGNTAFLVAAWNGHLPLVQWLVTEKGVSLKEKNDSGNTALLLSAMRGQLAVVQWLVMEKGISLKEKNKDGNTVLLVAAWNGHLPLIQWLVTEKGVSLKEKNNDGDTALLLAAFKGQLPLVQWLLMQPEVSLFETNKRGQTALKHARSQNHPKTVAFLEKMENLHRVVEQGSLSAVQQVLSQASPLEKQYAFRVAAQKGSYEVMQWLVQQEIFETIDNILKWEPQDSAALKIQSAFYTVVAKHLLSQPAEDYQTALDYLKKASAYKVPEHRLFVLEGFLQGLQGKQFLPGETLEVESLRAPTMRSYRKTPENPDVPATPEEENRLSLIIDLEQRICFLHTEGLLPSPVLDSKSQLASLVLYPRYVESLAELPMGELDGMRKPHENLMCTLARRQADCARKYTACKAKSQKRKEEVQLWKEEAEMRKEEMDALKKELRTLKEALKESEATPQQLVTPIEGTSNVKDSRVFANTL